MRRTGRGDDRRPALRPRPRGGCIWATPIAPRSAARPARGRFLLRIEDLDPGRCRPEFVDGDRRGPRLARARLGRRARLPVAARRSLCRGARALDARAGWSIPASAPAPTSPPRSPRRHGDAGRPLIPAPAAACPTIRSAAPTTPHSWRLDSAGALARHGLPRWTERTAEKLHRDRRRHRRRDPRPQGRARVSYHLACVVDDAASGVTLVVRGEDLRASTPVQRLLQALLGLPAPTYLHHPLVPTTTAAGSPSATRRRRWPRCAPAGSTARACGGPRRRPAAPWISPLETPKWRP